MSGGYDDDYGDDRTDRDEDMPRDDHRSQAAAERTSMPGIFLIIAGVLNLILALLQTGSVIITAMQPASEYVKTQEKFLDMMAEFAPQAKEELDKAKNELAADPEKAKSSALVQSGIGAAVLLVTGILPLLGGIRMRKLRSYGLAVTGSVVAAIPCLSPASCPCGIGLIFGIWALVVLLNADVKQAFR